MKTAQNRSFLAAALAGALVLTNARAAAEPAPRLVLQITVDQLRGDLPGRYLKNMGDGGWRYLMDQGVWYADTHHAHANTETIVGHATLATGADPAAHGMIGNVWLDRQTGTLTYNIEDPKYRILTPGADVNKATEIDPTQKLASTDGRSPAAILGSTFSDELAVHTAGRAKIFGVSVKDHGAVPMVRPTPGLLTLQENLIAALAPFTAATGTMEAFTARHGDPALDAVLIDYVLSFVPNQTGEHFSPHVSAGVAPREYLERMLAEPFEPFTFSPAGAAVYQLGPYGTAAKPLKAWKLKS